jgi:hypothetical protein
VDSEKPEKFFKVARVIRQISRGVETTTKQKVGIDKHLRELSVIVSVIF